MRTFYIPWLSIGLWRQRHHLAALLNASIRTGWWPAKGRHWIGWGRKQSYRRAALFARYSGTVPIALEDGFVRSMGLGRLGYPAWSLVTDDVGIYYESRFPSRLEQLVQQAAATQSGPGLPVISEPWHILVENNLSKYNFAPEVQLETDPEKPNILLVDQTRDDLSVAGAQAGTDDFRRMLETCLKRHPDSLIWIKTHPDANAGKKKGYLRTLLAGMPPDNRIRLLAFDLNPVALLKQMDQVYVVSSQLGFEALLCGKPVHCFGLPWYASWGVTQDHHPAAAGLYLRRGRASLHHLFTAAYLDYSHYLNPAAGQPGTLAEVLEVMATQKKWNDRLRGQVYALGFSPWKREFIRRTLALPSVKLRFIKYPETFFQLPPRTDIPRHLLVWGMKYPQLDVQRHETFKLWRMEDGFIRSRGLGAALVAPQSLVLDDQGIYYNTKTQSRLHEILAVLELNDAQRRVARQLTDQIVRHRVSKYNLNRPAAPSLMSLPKTLLLNLYKRIFLPSSVKPFQAEHWPVVPAGQRCILVPGQVDDDASLRYGAVPPVADSLALLKEVRSRNPDAFIVYKPHPDVVKGLRQTVATPEQIAIYADHVLQYLDMTDCLDHCDEVHTLTSLTGFEALLRQKPVTCYGRPFYAGWGLTNDMQETLPFVRRLDLETLVYAVLVEYPLYLSVSRQLHGPVNLGDIVKNYIQ